MQQTREFTWQSWNKEQKAYTGELVVCREYIPLDSKEQSSVTMCMDQTKKSCAFKFPGVWFRCVSKSEFVAEWLADNGDTEDERKDAVKCYDRLWVLPMCDQYNADGSYTLLPWTKPFLDITDNYLKVGEAASNTGLSDSRYQLRYVVELFLAKFRSLADMQMSAKLCDFKSILPVHEVDGKVVEYLNKLNHLFGLFAQHLCAV